MASAALSMAKLLKFAPDTGPYLCPEGLDALSRLPPPIEVVAFLGDGRCGKSFLASILAQGPILSPDGDVRPLFEVGGTFDPVTEGIDICVVPKLKGPNGSASSLVIMDCEGGNNPFGPIRNIVNIIAMLCNTLTVQVVSGQFTETQLEYIVGGLAERDRLLSQAERFRLPTQKLLLLANMCHLSGTQDDFAKMLREDASGPAAPRNLLRTHIKKCYEEVNFHIVPKTWETSHADALAAVVDANSGVFELGGTRSSGAQIAEFLRSVLENAIRKGVVPMQCVMRHVIYDHLLAPMVLQLSRRYAGTLPTKEDKEYKHDLSDSRPSILNEFENEVRGITHSILVEEARDDLTSRLADLWSRASDRNFMIGREVASTEILSKEVNEGTTEYTASVEMRFLMWRMQDSQLRTAHVLRTYESIRTHHKNGEVKDSEWQPKGHVRHEEIPTEKARWKLCFDRRTRATTQQPDHLDRRTRATRQQTDHESRPQRFGIRRSRHNQSKQSVSSSSTVDGSLDNTLDSSLGSSLLRSGVTEPK
jgi:hypothetical protein